jgi:hypothetical protein
LVLFDNLHHWRKSRHVSTTCMALFAERLSTLH